jgi:hypothetical protein
MIEFFPSREVALADWCLGYTVVWGDVCGGLLVGIMDVACIGWVSEAKTVEGRFFYTL